MLNTNHPSTTLWIHLNQHIVWLKLFHLHLLFVLLGDSNDLQQLKYFAHFSLIPINAIDGLLSLGCNSKYKKQSYTYPVCCCYIVWLDYYLIFLLSPNIQSLNPHLVMGWHALRSGTKKQKYLVKIMKHGVVRKQWRKIEAANIFSFSWN